MKGLPFKAVKSIEKLIEGKFDFLALNFLGMVPKQSGKSITFNTGNDSLVFLYLKALGHKKMTREERDLLKVILNIASGYIDSLKDRTKSKVINTIDAYVRSERMSNNVPKFKEMKSLIDKEMTSAKKHLQLIANSESNKSINYGMAMKIGRLAKRKKEDDPTVFFMVTIDDVTGDEEFKLHLLPDRKTPRVWKLSEIGSEYHKKGDPNPKFAGLHPNCRCKLAYLPKGWGFNDDGKIRFKGLDYDEYAVQRGESLNKAEDEGPMKHIYPTAKGKWELHDTAPAGLEHPDNINKPFHQHKTSHITEDGFNTWTIKNTDTKDDQFKGSTRRFFAANDGNYSEQGMQSLANLVNQVHSHPDRHAVHTGPNNNQKIRTRHLHNAFTGKEGYGVQEIAPDGQHKGWIIRADRHPGDKSMQTIWYWDGKSLKTHYHGPKKYL